MVPAGAVTQPLLIPISIAGQVAGQQGLAVWTIPTATVAALPGLTAASPTGGIFKPPLAGLQGNGHSPQDCTRPPQHPILLSLHVRWPCWTQNPRPTGAPALESGSGVPGTQPQSGSTTLGLEAVTPCWPSRPLLLQPTETAPLPPRQNSPHDQPREKDRKKIHLLVLNLQHLQAQGRGDERCCPVQGSRESQLPVPSAPLSQPPLILVPDPLGLEPLWGCGWAFEHPCLCLAP